MKKQLAITFIITVNALGICQPIWAVSCFDLLRQASNYENSIARQFDFYASDTLFDSSQYLRTTGRARNYSETLKDIEFVIQRHPNLRHAAHKALLLHGSTSASLIAFTQYNNYEGRLIPQGQLEKAGKISFSGEIIIGRNGVNKDHLSTVFIDELSTALSYTSKNQNRGFHPQEAEAALARYQAGFDYNKYPLGDLLQQLATTMAEVTAKRISEFKKLTSEEKEMVTEHFPVLYGLRTNRTDAIVPAWGSPLYEILLKDGAYTSEIKVIFVPRSKMSFVKNILSRQKRFNDIYIENIDDLDAKY